MLDAATTHALASHNPSDHHGCYSIRTPRWACVYTHPQAETWADTNLRRSGYRTFLPTHIVRIRDRATTSMVHHAVRPLFPRYLFLQFDHLAESWSPVRATPGVLDLIRSGSELHYANTGAVEALEATQDARRCEPPESSQWAPGASCAMRYGPCAGLPAVITSVARETATIAIMMLGHLRNVSVPLDCLKPRDD